MYYFLDGNIGQLASGIEHAEFKRLRLFNQYGVPAKIVTTAYSASTRRNNAFWGLSEANFVNMYDFYAGTEQVDWPKLTLTDLLDADQAYRIEKRENGATFWEGQRQIAAVTYFPQSAEVIRSVDYFDGDAQVIRTDMYDERGFLAYAKFMATRDDVSAGRVALEQFYTITGRPYLEITYRGRGNNVVPTNYRLLPTLGTSLSFMNKNQLIARFYDDLNRRDGEHATFISDRTAVANLPMTMMQTVARKIEFIHNIHFSPYREPFKSQLVYASLSQNEQLSRTDLVITSTPQQADDIRKRLKTQIPITNIPVGVVTDEQLALPPVAITAPPRVRGKIIVVARLFYEKNLSEAILAFQSAQAQHPWLTLDIYGYGDGINGNVEENRLHQLVKDTGLTDCVRFMGYTKKMAEVYQQAQLILLTSRLEGFALALLEANSYGVPAISYDTYYGPAYIIKNGESGYVIPYGDRDQLSRQISNVMTDTDLLQQLSTGAYTRARDFSTAKVWQAWKTEVIDTDSGQD